MIVGQNDQTAISFLFVVKFKVLRPTEILLEVFHCCGIQIEIITFVAEMFNSRAEYKLANLR
jgi:hypothetical protein